MLELRELERHAIGHELTIPAWAKAEQLVNNVALDEIWGMKDSVVKAKQKKPIRKELADGLRQFADFLYKEEFKKEIGYAKA